MNKSDWAHIAGVFIIICLLGCAFFKSKPSPSIGYIPINTQIKSVVELRIHESRLINQGLLVTKVPGGYIYNICVRNGEWRPVFVPLMKTPFPCII